MPIYVGDPDGITWDQARQKVRGDLWRPGTSLSDDTINRALHAAILELESAGKWLWLEQLTATAALAADQEFIDLPATIRAVSSIAVKRDNWNDPLLEKPLSVVRKLLGTDVGDPSSWAMQDSRIWFDSHAQAGTQFEMVVTFATPRRLELAIQSPSFTLQEQQQAVLAAACAHIALTFMKNADEAGRQRTAYESILQRLYDEEADKRGSAIQPDTWGMGYDG